MIRFVFAASIATFALATETEAQTNSHHMHSGQALAMDDAGAAQAGLAPQQAGQSAFAAIQEIVALLDADSRTDWSAVDIDALRSHLIDMSNVTLFAKVQTTPVEDGYRFLLSGDDGVRDSIRRMVSAHAATMSGVRSFRYQPETTPDGAVMIVRAGKPSDLKMLSGLGFFGVMTLGAHHQEHHLAIASGHAPHE
ncbi:hypothetical protein [Roseibium sp. M-1]